MKELIMPDVISKISASCAKYDELMRLTEAGKLVETELYLWNAYNSEPTSHNKCEWFLNLLITRAWMTEQGIEVPYRKLKDVIK
jgi:hypothetical protein